MKLFVASVDDTKFGNKAKELFFKINRKCYSIFYTLNFVMFSDEQNYKSHKKDRVDL